ncbi:hypothetical protein ACK83U_12420 [Rhizobium sp. WW22]|uniref:ribbon-helix-helix domain-containing protein n=1 Tax=Rhizobium sp. WW22 TaxID=3389070 RepID=UPI0013AF7444
MEQDVDVVRTSLRLPKALYDRLEQAAKARGLTMHAEILSRLESAMDSGPIKTSGRYPQPTLRLPAYTRQTLPPDLVHETYVQFAVTNPEEGKSHPVYSDGVHWRYVCDGSLVTTGA